MNVNKMVGIGRAALIALAFSFGVVHSVAQGAETKTWTCETPSNDEQRKVVVEVIYDNPPNKLPAQVSYTKFGEVINDALWRCDFTEGFCEEKAKELVKKFSDSDGWKCVGE